MMKFQRSILLSHPIRYLSLLIILISASLSDFPVSHASTECKDYFDSAASHSTKGFFHLNSGSQLQERITEDFKEDEKKFVASSAQTYKLSDYEMAVYHLTEAKKHFTTAENEFTVLAVQEDCTNELQQRSAIQIKALRTHINNTQEQNSYFYCQYKIDQSIKLLSRGQLFRKDKDYLQAQQLAAKARQILVNNTGEDSPCSNAQLLFGQSTYQQAWDLITATNKPLEMQLYCDSQLSSIILKIKDADIAKNESNHDEAKKNRVAASNQIEKLLHSKACSSNSTQWLKIKLTEIQ